MKSYIIIQYTFCLDSECMYEEGVLIEFYTCNSVGEAYKYRNKKYPKVEYIRNGCFTKHKVFSINLSKEQLKQIDKDLQVFSAMEEDRINGADDFDTSNYIGR